VSMFVCVCVYVCVYAWVCACVHAHARIPPAELGREFPGPAGAPRESGRLEKLPPKLVSWLLAVVGAEVNPVCRYVCVYVFMFV